MPIGQHCRIAPGPCTVSQLRNSGLQTLRVLVTRSIGATRRQQVMPSGWKGLLQYNAKVLQHRDKRRARHRRGSWVTGDARKISLP